MLVNLAYVLYCFIDLRRYTDSEKCFFENLNLKNTSKFILKLKDSFQIEGNINLIKIFQIKSCIEVKERIDKNYKKRVKIV